ncbi:biopolymer transporter ExbD [Leptolyngbya sp. FACHB-17]|uniref:ExbD/TolR family protein n=1 Tax=unclassified Leptolyngbya TaxID=2650499 RepID=UPI0016819ABB|nr:biopolymer transporter ExbD [Leptolyngbya sp. FACHB-17]MBD2078960.1 biopolymer transporter ExbD [Leptolyngbya sp. FACHB-17]
MLFSEDNDVPAQINIVPMIDVVFALLTFFIISTLFLTRSEGLPVNLPRAATSKSQQQTRIAVSVKPSGELALNKRSVQLSELQAGVRTLMQANQQAVVVINADEKVEHGQIVSVMDEIRKIEGVKMAIATKKK